MISFQRALSQFRCMFEAHKYVFIFAVHSSGIKHRHLCLVFFFLKAPLSDLNHCRAKRLSSKLAALSLVMILAYQTIAFLQFQQKQIATGMESSYHCPPNKSSIYALFGLLSICLFPACLAPINQQHVVFPLQFLVGLNEI